jgi:hypothetical protein
MGTFLVRPNAPNARPGQSDERLRPRCRKFDTDAHYADRFDLDDGGNPNRSRAAATVLSLTPTRFEPATSDSSTPLCCNSSNANSARSPGDDFSGTTRSRGRTCPAAPLDAVPAGRQPMDGNGLHRRLLERTRAAQGSRAAGSSGLEDLVHGRDIGERVVRVGRQRDSAVERYASSSSAGMRPVKVTRVIESQRVPHAWLPA